MDESLVATIMSKLEAKKSEQILKAWKRNDTDRWSTEALEAMQRTLVQRGFKLPRQFHPPVEGKPARIKGGSGGVIRLVRPPRLVFGEGEVVLESKYDPPGNGWRALLVTVITVFVVYAIAKGTGAAAGPGIIVWFLIIRAVRRKENQWNLREAKEIVIDKDRRRISLLLPFGDKDAWAGMKISSEDEGVFDELLATPNLKIQEGEL